MTSAKKKKQNKPKEIQSTIQLPIKEAYYAGTTQKVPKKRVLKDLRKAIEYGCVCQQEMLDETIRTNFDFDIKYHHNVTARQIINFGSLPKETVRNYEMRILHAAESYRIYQTYKTRCDIARDLEEKKWNATNQEMFDLSCKYKVDFEEVKNIKRSQKIPKSPKIRHPRLTTADSTHNLMEQQWDGESRITITNFCPVDTAYDLFFEIPHNFLKTHPNITKMCKPVIRVDNRNQIVFDFTAKEKCIYDDSSPMIVAVDLGVVYPFVACVFDTVNAEFSRPVGPSKQTMVYVDHIEDLDKQINDLSERINNLKISGCDYSAQHQLLLDYRAKRRVLRRELSWQIALDVAALCHDGSSCVHESLSFVTTSSCWRSSTVDDIDHVLWGCGIPCFGGLTAYSSQVCPFCGSIMTEDANRVKYCSCGFSIDRDFLSCVNQALWSQECSYDRIVLPSVVSVLVGWDRSNPPL